jgi:alkanesulfonate monooxygenase SsuD/methylene tetrahydromethanopterin reductase-like flavin-dependent oxidoreductase (luciferase family)
MRTGLFCTYENPQRDFRSAYAEQTKLVKLVETLGFEEAWVAEHHFNPDAASPSCLAILAHLAARTARIRLGSAAVLLPFRNPIQVAEDIATLDILSEGRFDFGVAKGGPFPAQNKHFGVSKDDSRARMLEALSLIRRLLSEDGVCFDGRFFTAENVNLTPKPLQSPIPTFIATLTADAVKTAARHGYGLMGAPPFPLESAQGALDLYRETAPQRDPALVLIRFYHLAPTHARAVDEAAFFLRSFIERMQTTTATTRPDWTAWFKRERLIEDSLIGTPAEVRDKVLRIEAELRPHSLILKPISPDFVKRRADLESYGETIRPLLRAPHEPGLDGNRAFGAMATRH